MIMLCTPVGQLDHLDRETVRFYRRAMRILTSAGISFLVGGSYSLTTHTQMPRRTKDLDLFVMPEDVPLVLETFAVAGYRSELVYPHWLAKIHRGEDFVDMIFNSGNGLCRVDQEWFEHALPGMVLDMPVQLCPLEETIWQKSFIMERHRYDGADVVHLIRAGGTRLDWQRLLRRFGPHWRVLLSHLVLYGFIYPADEALVPAWVREELVLRYQREGGRGLASNRLCGGTFLSSLEYRGDLENEGFSDARLKPNGNMSAEELSHWMASFDNLPVGDGH
jgi:hypothetical protein